MKKFEIGKEYFDRSACNYDCIFTIVPPESACQ